MQEIGVVTAIIALLLFVVFLASAPGDQLILMGQSGMLTLGAVGVGLEVVYFALLGAALHRRKVAPKGWYWRSFAHHHLLSKSERRVIMPFFVLGAIAFLLIVLFIIVTVAGVVSLFVQMR